MVQSQSMSTPGILVLEDGEEFPGILFGAPLPEHSPHKPDAKAPGYGEVVFNTSMTGYQEILTDPSYFGQIVCMTSPHIGNTGINSKDHESSRAWCSGLIVHENSPLPSNWQSEDTLENYLKKNNIPGIQGIDTRALTRHLRTKGVARGILLPAERKSQARELLSLLPGMEGRDLIAEVSTSKPYRWETPVKLPNQPIYKVVAVDFGIKWNLLRCLQERGCEVEVVPAHSSADYILARKPDGVFLSNGPGDPMAAPYAVQTVKNLIGKVPIFGVCMGHQILALACGAKTYKLKFGHRGGNQPVLQRSSKRVEISSHNHGYSVDANSLPASLEVTHINLNDKTVEGFRMKGSRAFSVQYHPEAAPGPQDSVGLFDQFIHDMRENVSKIS